eukprot:Skav236004  [mRNA]  locus=scaffold348:574491:584068:- [translate_table: standard]
MEGEALATSTPATKMTVPRTCSPLQPKDQLQVAEHVLHHGAQVANRGPLGQVQQHRGEARQQRGSRGVRGSTGQVPEEACSFNDHGEWQSEK